MNTLIRIYIIYVLDMIFCSLAGTNIQRDARVKKMSLSGTRKICRGREKFKEEIQHAHTHTHYI